LKTFKIENHILGIKDLPLVILMVIAEFNLFVIFSLFGNTLGSIFTLDKFYFIFLYFIILLHVFIYRSRYLKRLFSYLKYYIAFLVFITLSNWLNPSLFSLKTLFQLYGYISFSFCFIIVIRSLGLLKLFFYLSSIVAVLISFLQLTQLVELDHFSNKGDRIEKIEEYIMTDKYGDNEESKVEERGQFLWISSNNLAYLLSPYLIFLLYILISAKTDILAKGFSLIGIPIIFMSILSTTSRGGVITTLIGIIALVKFANVIKLKNLVYIIGLLILLPIIVIPLTSSSGFKGVSNKFSPIIEAIQDKDVSKLGGSFSRVATTFKAIEEIRAKPIFGWGHNKAIGVVGKASPNHNAILQIIAQVGLAGFLWLIIILYKSSKGTLKTINYYKLVNSKNYCFGYFLITLTIMFFISSLFQPSNSILSISKFLIVYSIYPENLNKYI